MPSLDGLPDELLLAVARFMDQESLYNLSLTQRCLEAITREVLYNAPCIPSPYGPDGLQTVPTNRVLHLVRTLLDCPEHSRYIRILTVTTGLCEVPGEGFGFADMCHKAGRIIDSLADGSSSWEKIARLWKESLRLGDHNPWCGVLLAVVPRLETLSVKLLDPDQLRGDETPFQVSQYSLNPLGSLFGQRFRYNFVNFGKMFEKMSGFNKLKHLDYYGCTFDLDWLNLPSLRQIHLLGPVNCSLWVPTDNGHPSIEPPQWRSTITHLTWTRSFEDLFNPAWTTDQLSLEHQGQLFPKLRHLTLHLQTYHEESNRSIKRPTLVDMFGTPLTPTLDDLYHLLQTWSLPLETLHIDTPPRAPTHFLDEVHPFTTCAGLATLKHLVLPQSSFLDENDSTATSPSTFLPRGLETLGVIYPTAALWTWLADIVPDMRFFPKLRRVDLYCSVQRGDGFEEVSAHDGPGRRMVEGAGVVVSVLYRDEDLVRGLDVVN